MPIKNAYPYQKDKMNLPVANVESAIPFYQSSMGFTLVSCSNDPVVSAILQKDGVQIGLAENGGDPTQDGCFFEVESVEEIFSELKSLGLKKEISDFDIQEHNGVPWKVFFIVAPDGLCYCFGEKCETRDVK
jgi:lactoylglutathione lyase